MFIIRARAMPGEAAAEISWVQIDVLTGTHAKADPVRQAIPAFLPRRYRRGGADDASSPSRRHAFGTGLDKFEAKSPTALFDVGSCRQHR